MCQIGILFTTSTYYPRIIAVMMAIISPLKRTTRPQVRPLHASGTSVANPGFSSTHGIHQTMSFQRKGPGVLASGVIGVAVGFAIVSSIIALLALPASAQTGNTAAQVSGEFERPFGFSYGQEQSTYDANTRDGNGNRIILDGRIMTGMDQSTLSTTTASAGAWAQASAGAGYGAGVAQGTAVGNQLNVITQGNWNTVIVNSTQINNGNQTSVLNGKIDLQ